MNRSYLWALEEPGPSRPPYHVSLRLVFRPALEGPGKTSEIVERYNPGYKSEGDLTDSSDSLIIFGAWWKCQFSCAKYNILSNCYTFYKWRSHPRAILSDIYFQSVTDAMKWCAANSVTRWCWPIICHGKYRSLCLVCPPGTVFLPTEVPRLSIEAIRLLLFLFWKLYLINYASCVVPSLLVFPKIFFNYL